jgi:hypothetical protein
MNQKEIFAIEDVLPVDTNAWRVKGRAYEDLKVGDVVTISEKSQGRTIRELTQYVVDAISTYGKSVDTLNQMLTGELLLRGTNGEKLKAERMLVALSDFGSE